MVCKTSMQGFDSPPSLKRDKISFHRAGSSVVERVPDKNEVQGSIPCPPTYLLFTRLTDENL